jgi:hypothetical protein
MSKRSETLSDLPAALRVIVADIEAAARRDLSRSAPRRSRARWTAVVIAAAVLVGGGVAAASGSLDSLVSLITAANPDTKVIPLSPAQSRIISHLSAAEGGGTADVVATDLGVTTRDTTASNEVEVCEPAGTLLRCSYGTGTGSAPIVTIPAGTRVYRLNPTVGSHTQLERSTLYIPSASLEMVTDPTPAS